MAAILSAPMIDWLKRCGVIPEHAHKVVITLQAGDVARIESWSYLQDGVLKMLPPSEVIDGERIEHYLPAVVELGDGCRFDPPEAELGSSSPDHGLRHQPWDPD